MSGRMRIGEHLLLRESIDALVLSQTVREQQETGQRLVSTLILRALIEADEGALALSEQTGFPAALQRHLERRDVAASILLPAQLARTWVVVPIGRSHGGDLVICARDPTPILAAALEHATGKKIKLAVAPAIHIEKLVRSIYGAGGHADTPLPIAPPTISDIGETEVGVARPPTQPRRPRTVSKAIQFEDSGPVKVPMRSMTSLEITLQEMDQAFSIVAIERLVMSYAAQRWDSALLVRIDGDTAIGLRGHGDNLGVIEAITLPLTAPSLISLAVETRHTTVDAPDTPAQAHLSSLLGEAERVIAAPVEARGIVRAVLVVGDAMEGIHRDSVVEIDRLTDALGAAYDRFARAQTRDP
ncbi:MAG: hypothetical protein M4D80_22980 [Myxococcota bacterium]|nr:hypothetical protein [Myxococcota bacterium]